MIVSTCITERNGVLQFILACENVIGFSSWYRLAQRVTLQTVYIIREAALSEAEQTVYTCAQLPDTR